MELEKHEFEVQPVANESVIKNKIRKIQENYGTSIKLRDLVSTFPLNPFEFVRKTRCFGS